MVTNLGRDDFLLDESDKLLALRQGQAQSRDVAQITGTVNLQHINASNRSFSPDFHQAQNPPHS